MATDKMTKDIINESDMYPKITDTLVFSEEVELDITSVR